MIFPNGTMKEGLFEFNIYKGKIEGGSPIENFKLSNKASNNHIVILNPQTSGSFKQAAGQTFEAVQLPDINQQVQLSP